MMTMLIPGTRLRVARVGEVLYTGPGTCGYGTMGCRQRILWARTVNDRPIALNSEPNEYGYYIVHQSTCPSRHQFETSRRR
jgi:hypothetical protein